MKIDQVIVFAHGCGQNNFNRLAPYWKLCGAPVTVRSPEDDPIKTDDFRLILHGKSTHAGKECVERTTAGMRYALSQPGEHFVFHEYDSLEIEAGGIKPMAGLQCIRAPRSDPRFGSHFQCNFPWVFSRQALCAVLKVIDRYPDIYEEGNSDTWMGLLSHLANIPVRCFQPATFSVDHIAIKNIGALHEAIHKGATVFHGVKKQWELDFILDERERFIKGFDRSFITKPKLK